MKRQRDDENHLQPVLLAEQFACFGRICDNFFEIFDLRNLSWWFDMIFEALP